MAESHFSSLVVRKWIDDEKNFLITPYWESGESYLRADPPQIKFPGGKGEQGESPLMTLHREFREESDLILLTHSPRFLLRQACPPDDPAFDIHVQWYYLADDHECMGSERKTLLKGPRSWLGPMRWVPESKLGRIIHHSHRGAFEEARKQP